MIAYKLVRLMKDGTLRSLFINNKVPLELDTWLEAGCYPTRGFFIRKGFHCCLKPNAPHLKMKLSNGEQRVWVEVEVEDTELYDRPESQGGTWVLCQKMRILRILNKPVSFGYELPKWYLKRLEGNCEKALSGDLPKGPGIFTEMSNAIMSNYEKHCETAQPKKLAESKTLSEMVDFYKGIMHVWATETIEGVEYIICGMFNLTHGEFDRLVAGEKYWIV